MKADELGCTPWECSTWRVSARERKARAELWLETSMPRIRDFIAESETRLDDLTARRRGIEATMKRFRHETEVEAVKRFREDSQLEAKALDRAIDSTEEMIALGKDAAIACGNGARFVYAVEGLTVDVLDPTFNAWRLLKRWFKRMLHRLRCLALGAWEWLVELRECVVQFLRSFVRTELTLEDAKRIAESFQLWLEHTMPEIERFLAQKESQLEYLRSLLEHTRKHTKQYKMLEKVLRAAEGVVILGWRAVRACRRAAVYLERNSENIAKAVYEVLAAWIAIRQWVERVNEGDHDWVLGLWHALQDAYQAAKGEIKVLWCGLMAFLRKLFGPELGPQASPASA